MKKSFYMGAAALLAAIMLSACGEEGDVPGGNGSFKEVATIEDLGTCEKANFGEIVYVVENDSLYECTSDGWVATDSSAIESSDSADGDSTGKSSSSFKVDSSDVADVDIVKIESTALTGFAQKGPFVSGSAVTVFGLDSALEKTKTKFTGKVSNDSGAFLVEEIELPSQFALVQVSGNYLSEISGKKTSGSKTTLNAIVDLSAVDKNKSVKANVNIFTELEYARVKYLVAKEKFNVPAAKKRATKELLAFFGVSLADSLNISSTEISLADTTAAGTALLSASVLLQGDFSATKLAKFLTEIVGVFAETGAIADKEIRAELADWASKVDSTDNFESIIKNIKDLKITSKASGFKNQLYTFWTNEYGLNACTDSLEETIAKNENKESENYGKGYACTSRRWHKSSELDTDLGLCVAKKEGNYVERKTQKNPEYYVCRTGTWQKITDEQYELKECTEERNDEYVATQSENYFVCKDKQWVEIKAVDYELKLCTESRNGEYAATKSEKYYVCESDEWESIDYVAFELKKCSEDRNKELFKVENENDYVCEKNEDDEWKWREATKLESDIGVCGSNAHADSSIVKASDESYYACLASEWTEIDDVTGELGFCKASNNGKINKSVSDTYYQCENLEWVDAEKLAFEIQNLGSCSNENVFELKATESLGDYVCRTKDGGYSWEKASEIESDIGVCGAANTDSLVKKTKNELYYACLSQKWVESDSVVFELGFCKASNKGVHVTAAKKYFECKDLKWSASTQEKYELQALGSCTTNRNLELATTATLGDYVCRNGTWSKASAVESEIGVCGTKANPDSSVRKTNAGKYYACLSKQWSVSTSLIYELGFCKASNEYSVKKTASGYYYACIEKSWKSSDAVSYDIGVCKESMENTLKLRSSNNAYYVCSNKTWRAASNIEAKFGVCRSAIKDSIAWTINGDTLTSSSYKKWSDCKVSTQTPKLYRCTDNEWKLANFTEADVGYCTSAREGEFVSALVDTSYISNNKKIRAYDGYAVCKSNVWVHVRQLDYQQKEVCVGTQKPVKNGYVCENNSWRVASNYEKDAGRRCMETGMDGVVVGDSIVCKGTSGVYAWQPATVNELGIYHNSFTKCSGTDTTLKHSYVCENSAYRKASALELNTAKKACVSINNEKFVWYNNTSPYRCVKNTSSGNPYIWKSWTYDVIYDYREKNTTHIYRTLTIGSVTVMVDDLKYHGSGIGDSAVGWKDIGTTTVYRWTAAADKSTSYLKNTASLNALHQGICPNGWHLPSSLNEYPRPTMENGLISPEQKCVSYDEYKLCNLRQAYWTTNNYKDSANVLYFYRYANGYDDTYSVKKRYKNTFNVVRCVKD